jgi:propanol-preferring alcohol dehydrogenase
MRASHFHWGEVGSDISIAPLLCAGLIGWRSLVIAGEAKKIGFYGFGAAAHILAQVARWQGRSVYAFTRPGDAKTQAFAKSLGASGPAAPTRRRRNRSMPRSSLRRSGRWCRGAQGGAQGGRVVCAGIHMSDIPSFPYGILWEERELLSVANLTRKDGLDFLRWRRRSASR